MRKSASIAALIVALVPVLTPGLALADACMAHMGAPAMQGAGPGDGAGMGSGMGSGMGPGPMGPDFATLDSNADGKVTAEEVTAWRTAQFAAADANSDGKLAADELTVWIEARRAERQAQMAARMMTRLDADGDGSLSLVELPGADMANRLGWLDRNADGAIDAGEFAALGQGGPGRGDGARGDGDCEPGRHGRGGMH